MQKQASSRRKVLSQVISASKKITAVILAASFFLSPMQIALAKEAATPEKTPPEKPSEPRAEKSVSENRKPDPSKRPTISLPLAARPHADPPGLDDGEEEPPPEDEGGFETLTEEDPFPFTYERVSHAKTPQLTPNESTGAFQYTIPIITPPGRNGLKPNLELVYDSSFSKNEYFGLV
jgi:hypothetical protein